MPCCAINSTGKPCKRPCKKIGDMVIKFCSHHYDVWLKVKYTDWSLDHEQSKDIYFAIVYNTFGSIERIADISLESLSIVFEQIFGCDGYEYVSIFKTTLNYKPEFLGNSFQEIKEGKHKSYKDMPYKKMYICECCNVTDETYKGYECSDCGFDYKPFYD